MKKIILCSFHLFFVILTLIICCPKETPPEGAEVQVTESVVAAAPPGGQKDESRDSTETCGVPLRQNSEVESIVPSRQNSEVETCGAPLRQNSEVEDIPLDRLVINPNRKFRCQYCKKWFGTMPQVRVIIHLFEFKQSFTFVWTCCEMCKFSNLHG